MSNPLSAAHKLVVNRIPKSVTHATVMACQANAGFDHLAQMQGFGLFDFRHGVDRYDQRIAHQSGIEKCGRFGFDPDFKPFLFQPFTIDGRTEIRIMARPSSPHYESLTHRSILPLNHGSCSADQSIWPFFIPAGSMLGRSTVVSSKTRRPSSEEI